MCWLSFAWITNETDMGNMLKRCCWVLNLLFLALPLIQRQASPFTAIALPFRLSFVVLGAKQQAAKKPEAFDACMR